MRSNSEPQFRHLRWIRSWRAAVAGLALLPLPALCDEAHGILGDSFNIALGTFIVNTDTTLRLDGAGGERGVPIDWEKDFGDGDVYRFRFDGYWRFADRHKLRALVFSSSRSATRTFDDDLEWGGDTFQANANIKGKIKFSIYELAYEYAFLRRKNYELAASLGLHYLDYDATLEGNATVAGTTGEIVNTERTGNIGAPLPVVGLRGTWVFAKTFSFDLSAQYFSLSYGDYDGNIQDYRALLNWQPKRWLGIGIGYDLFSLDVDLDSHDFNGNVDWRYKGPMIFYSASF